MSDLNKLTIAEARDNLRAGKVSAVELTDACLTAIDGAGVLNAFVHDTPQLAREMAKAADHRIKAGDGVAMTGIPLGIKDLFCTRGVATQDKTLIVDGTVVPGNDRNGRLCHGFKLHVPARRQSVA